MAQGEVDGGGGAAGAADGEIAKQLYERFDPRHYRIDVRQAPLLRLYIAYDSVNERWLTMQLLHHLAGDHRPWR